LADILRDPKGDNITTSQVRKLRRLGHVYRSKGMYPEAIEGYRKALELKPGDASLHYGLGLVYSRLGKPQEAKREFARSATVDPMYGDPLRYDADYFFNKELYEEALPLYEEILKKNPTYLKGLFGAGLCSSRGGKLEKAAEYYRRCIGLRPDFSLPHFSLGVVYSEMGKWKEAEEEYKRALELNPHDGKAYENLGGLYGMRGEVNKAIGAFERAVETNPCFKRAHNNLGGLYMRVGRYDEAIREFRNAVKIDPHYAPGYSNLGKVYLIQGNLNDALEALRRALSIDPSNPWARYYLGRTYLTMGRYGEAVSAYEEVMQIHPDFFPAYIDLARILGEKGVDLDRALKLAQRAVELQPSAQTFDLLAWLYFKRGMYGEAQEAIERAVELAPNNESIMRHREAIRRRMGQQ
jgi:superkiller protein 3